MANNPNEKLKSMIRSLLLSAPNGLSLQQLETDYLEYNGQKPPVRQLGFNSLYEYVHSIPDVVNIKNKRRGEYLLYAVANSATAHIQEMINRQKNTSKRVRAGFKIYRPHSLMGQRFPPRNSPVPQSVQHVEMREPELNSPDEYKEQKNGNGMRKRTLPPRFQKVSKCKFLEQFEFSSTNVQEECGSTNVQEECGSTNVQEECGSRNVQEECGSANVQEECGSRNVQEECGSRNVQDLQNFKTKSDNHSSVCKSSESLNQTQEVSDTRAFHSECGDSFPDSSLGSYNGDFVPFYGPWVTQGVPESVVPSRDDIVLNLVSQKMRDNFQTILNRNPNGIWASELAIMYQKMYGCSLHPREYGCENIIELASNLKSVFEIYRPNKNSDYLLFDVRKGVPDTIKEDWKKKLDQDMKKLQQPHITISIRTKVMNVLDAYPIGIRGENFLRCYQRKTECELDVLKLGFDSLESFFIALRESHSLKLKYETEGIIVFPISPEDVPLNARAVPIKESMVKAFPDDVVGPSEIYSLVQIPKPPVGSTKLHWVDICVAEIYTPWRFFVQLHTDVELDKLMANLDKFYTQEKANEYKLQTGQLLLVGQVVAALYEDQWHRGKIASMKNEDCYVINYIDYGTKVTCPRENIRLLHRQFFDFPAQAIQVKLSNIKPPNNELQWEKSTCVYFRDLLYKAESSRLPALFKNIDEHRRRVDIGLYKTYTDGREDRDFSIEMIQSGLAELNISNRPLTDSEWLESSLFPSTSKRSVEPTSNLVPTQDTLASKPTNTIFPATVAAIRFTVRSTKSKLLTNTNITVSGQPIFHRIPSPDQPDFSTPPPEVTTPFIPPINLTNIDNSQHGTTNYMSSLPEFVQLSMPPHFPSVPMPLSNNVCSPPLPVVMPQNVMIPPPLALMQLNPRVHAAAEAFYRDVYNECFVSAYNQQIQQQLYADMYSRQAAFNSYQQSTQNQVDPYSGPPVQYSTSRTKLSATAPSYTPKLHSSIPKEQAVPVASVPEKPVSQESAKSKSPDLSEMDFDDALDQMCDDLDDFEFYDLKYFMPVELPGKHQVHIVNMQKAPYLVSSEISLLIPVFNGEDILEEKLQEKKLVIPNLKIKKESSLAFFEDMAISKVHGWMDVTNGKPVTEVTLYSMYYISQILNKFDVTDMELRIAFSDKMKNFDPNSEYWRT